MILYLLAKWMEERTGLIKRIREQKGDTGLLRVHKEHLEQKLLAQAAQWREGRLLVSASDLNGRRKLTAEPDMGLEQSRLVISAAEERERSLATFGGDEEYAFQTAWLSEENGDEREMVL